MSRSSWKGTIRLSLVSIPVQAYTASASGAGQIQLNQLHESCHSRIRYQKICPIHGEVPNDQIVKGYEYAKGQYVVIDPDEIEKLRSEADRAVNIDRFVRSDQIDPIYLEGKNHCLTPDGVAGRKAYALLRQVLLDEALVGVAQVVLGGKEELVLLRPLDDLLCLSALRYASQVKKPGLLREEVPRKDFSAKELELTKSLVEATTAQRFEPEQYEDLYTKRLTALVEMKVAGEEVVAVPEEPVPQVINLMEALKASLAQTKAGSRDAGKPAPKPSDRKMAGSSRSRTKQKKTG